MERVDNTPFREAFLQSKLSSREICEPIGFLNKSTSGRRKGDPTAPLYDVADITRLKRVLGVSTSYSHGKPYIQKTITYDLALKLLDIFLLDPVDVGI